MAADDRHRHGSGIDVLQRGGPACLHGRHGRQLQYAYDDRGGGYHHVLDGSLRFCPTTKRVDDLASNSYTRAKRPGVSPAPFGHKRRAKLVGLRRLCLMKRTYEINIRFDIKLRLDL